MTMSYYRVDYTTGVFGAQRTHPTIHERIFLTSLPNQKLGGQMEDQMGMEWFWSNGWGMVNGMEEWMEWNGMSSEEGRNDWWMEWNGMDKGRELIWNGMEWNGSDKYP